MSDKAQSVLAKLRAARDAVTAAISDDDKTIEGIEGVIAELEDKITQQRELLKAKRDERELLVRELNASPAASGDASTGNVNIGANDGDTEPDIVDNTVDNDTDDSAVDGESVKSTPEPETSGDDGKSNAIDAESADDADAVSDTDNADRKPSRRGRKPKTQEPATVKKHHVESSDDLDDFDNVDPEPVPSVPTVTASDDDDDDEFI